MGLISKTTDVTNLGPIYTKRQCQRWDDTYNITLIEINGNKQSHLGMEL